MIRICLVRIWHRGTVVAGVPQTVLVSVLLSRIRYTRAVVNRTTIGREARVAKAISIGVGACIAQIADAVSIRILLQGVRSQGAVVTGVPDSVLVRIFLKRVAHAR